MCPVKKRCHEFQCVAIFAANLFYDNTSVVMILSLPNHPCNSLGVHVRSTVVLQV